MEDIFGAIERGDYDSIIDDIERALHQRRKVVGSLMVAHAEIGGRMVIGSYVSPKYLSGAVVELIERGPLHCKVKLTETRRRFRQGTIITIPTELLREA